MTQRTAPWENWHLERGFELLRTFGLVRWGLGGSDHVEVTKLSASTEAQLLPTTSSSAAKSSESQPPVPSVITTSSASISLITSTTTMFTALSNKTHPSALETTTSNSIPSTIISPVSHASTLKSRRKKRNPKTICNVTGPTVKPKIEIKMAPINREKVHLFKTLTMKT
ncbi:hypothetical protein TNCV_3937751 [Trichonephila clavipes]|nr:hypothetical protein TNCV_3937751 [Trichonephila clavipes]